MNKNVGELEAYIEHALQDWHVAGGAVSVVQADDVITCRGYGIREIGSPALVDGETIFGIGSNTKSFTAAAIGMLVDEGKLLWDDPVVKYLPDFEMSDAWVTGQVTLRDMLSHRTGMGRAMRLIYNKTFSNAEIVRRLRYFKPVAPFRYDFGYNNFHYMTAGLVLEAVTGQSWPEFINSRIFAPLGMTRSFADLQSMAGVTNLSGAHANLDDSLLPHHARLFAPETVVEWDDVGNQPAGGINSSAADLTHWMRMLLARGKWQGQTLLSERMIDQMTTPCIAMLNPLANMLAPIAMMKPEIHFYTYGLGWFVMDYKGYKMYMHGGQITGFNSAVVLVPEAGLGFSILLNSHQTVLHMPLVFKILDFFLGSSQRDWSQEYLGLMGQFSQMELAGFEKLAGSQKPGTQTALPLDAYAGEYCCDLMGPTRVSLENDCLWMEYGAGYRGDLVHWQDDTFYARWQNRTFDHQFVTFHIEDRQVTALEVKNEAVYRRTGP